MSTAAAAVVVHASVADLADAVAARLVARLVQAQQVAPTAHVVLTGGTIGTAVLHALARTPARATVDWPGLHVWWGDERFLPKGHPDRNETQARAALLDHVPLDSANVHPMPASDGPDGPDLDAAAQRYADTLAAHAPAGGHQRVPAFDVLLLGVGPDGHVASLFPGRPAVHETVRTVVGVHGAPKPPPLRISMTFPALHAARERWLVVAGAEKAAAVRMALGGAGPVQVPAAGVGATRWLLDRAAASALPPGLGRLADG